ncbi:MAG: hypothetical protein IPL32_00975 [Chloracidobacterium sp.]|nr:hypothetical protein [Chloracidobacterium sp.]
MKYSSIAWIILLLLTSVSISAQLGIQAVDVTGDSISKGFNAGSASPCSNGDQENFNWITSDTHGFSFCKAGSENVFSIFEQMECDAGMSLFAPQPNSAASGATMVSDFVSQANSVRSYLSGQPATRMAVVFLGHNDNCSGTIAKTNASCSSTDRDPANYCKMRPDAFERELRKGLDVLMSIGDTRVGVLSPIRVSQLCNFGSKSNCALFGNCQFLWGVVNICGSLTRDCSATRITDAYNAMKTYRDIIKRVAEEYGAVRVGGRSPVVMIGGQIVGGGLKAPGTVFVHSDVPWFYKFKSEQISCCDCFHPSGLGQDALAKLLKNGLSCTRANPCCKDTGDPLADGKCSTLNYIQTHYNGLF